MRLWHQDLISKLPRQQLTSQHRECCALRGNGWNKKHSTVNYVFDHEPNRLYLYHMMIMSEMIKRKPDSTVDRNWFDDRYRGKKCEKWVTSPYFHNYSLASEKIYPEHNNEYLRECLINLRQKGIIL
jgi:uncharacterized protein (TIGR02328 family)